MRVCSRAQWPQLVTHTSGLSWRRMRDVDSTGGFFQRAMRLDPQAAPGTQYRYSNWNAILAGLFSNARDLSSFCSLWLNQGTWNGRLFFQRETWQRATSNLSTVEGNPRGFFWDLDLLSIDRPTCMSERAYGHAGHTGQSIWIDPARGIFTVVLTNRNHPKYEPASTPRGREQYRARSRIGDALIRAISREKRK